jgi:predicted extracellular nuclease
MAFRNVRGDEASRRIYPGDSVTITQQEREYHSAGTRGDHNDIFKTGALTPITVGAGVVRSANAITPTELDGIFALPVDAFEVRIGQVTAQEAIDRIYRDATERDVAVSRLGVVEQRRSAIMAARLSGSGVEVSSDGRRRLDLQEEDYSAPGQSSDPRPAQTSTRRKPTIAR